MKNIFLIFITLVLASSITAQKINTPYNYPTVPGSEKWKSFKTVDEMYKECQIPNDILSTLTTRALLQTCLNYPVSTITLSHNTPQQGTDDWKQRFNGIAELLMRSDAKEELLILYTSFNTNGHLILNTSTDKGAYTFRLSLIENILVQNEILNKLNEKQKKSLLKNCLEKYNGMKSDDMYGFWSIASTGRIISKVSSELGDENLKKKIQTEPVKEYIKTGLIPDRQVLIDIISEAEKINTND
ncbi:MAG TPA: hypothetical protein VF610_04390 [Segetibacter sp.]|jgi:hypothetical protein